MKAGHEYELPYWQNQQLVIGIDEAGRGPIAGPLVVGAVVLPPYFDMEGIYDSKKLTKKQKDALYPKILEESLFYCVIVKDEAFIDTHNIYQATKLAMQECMDLCCLNIHAALTDAMPLNHHEIEVIPIIKGDQKSISIAAASILAKVTRDRIMDGYDKIYPEYGFARHKGYPTSDHLDQLRIHGICPIHRKSYGPVAQLSQISIFDLD